MSASDNALNKLKLVQRRVESLPSEKCGVLYTKASTLAESVDILFACCKDLSSKLELESKKREENDKAILDLWDDKMKHMEHSVCERYQRRFDRVAISIEAVNASLEASFTELILNRPQRDKNGKFIREKGISRVQEMAENIEEEVVHREREDTTFLREVSAQMTRAEEVLEKNYSPVLNSGKFNFFSSLASQSKLIVQDFMKELRDVINRKAIELQNLRRLKKELEFESGERENNYRQFIVNLEQLERGLSS